MEDSVTNDALTVDVVVVGGGPAALSAALVLGRCRRTVILCDSGEYRNAPTPAMYGFLSRDGCEPAELRRIAREQLRKYTTVTIWNTAVTDARTIVSGGFEIHTSTGMTVRSRLLLLATGVVDDLPTIDGASEFFGRGVFQCPYCDGFEVAGRPLVVYGRRSSAVGLALELLGWSDQVRLCSDGLLSVTDAEHKRLDRNGIIVDERRIVRLKGSERLEAVEFASGPAYACGAMFFATGEHQRSDLAARLGCEFTPEGTVATGEYETTCVNGLFVAGDASRRMQLAIVAAAEGAEAAAVMNAALLEQDLK